MNSQANRSSIVESAIGEIKSLHATQGDGPAFLNSAAEVLARLAERHDVFSLQAFPPPAPGGANSLRYALHSDPDQRFALYINALLPGKTSVPHDHGTWAVIVAVQGEETNRIYRRAGTPAQPDRILLDHEFKVRPGSPALYAPQDIHSIHLLADQPALLFHLYGRALETLHTRRAYDLATGESYSYNEKHYRPNA